MWNQIIHNLTLIGEQLYRGIEPKKWLVAYLVMSIPMLFFIIWSIRLNKELIVVSVRATLQLIFIGIVLIPIFSTAWYIKYQIILVMIIVGAFIARERSGKIKYSYIIALGAITVSYLAIIGIFLLTGAIEKEAMVIIPISGMLIGNSVKTISLNFHKTIKDFDDNKDCIEAMLIDGASISQAIAIPSQLTLKNAMVPRIDSLKTLGIVHIPGAMAGLIIAGTNPMKAAGYQIVIFFGIVSISALATVLVNKLCYRSLFHSRYPHLKEH